MIRRYEAIRKFFGLLCVFLKIIRRYQALKKFCHIRKLRSLHLKSETLSVFDDLNLKFFSIESQTSVCLKIICFVLIKNMNLCGTLF